MHHLVRTHGLGRTLSREGPSLVAAFVIAELFYKLGSFSLECAAFLATWWGLSFLSSFAFADGRAVAGRTDGN